MPLTVEDRLGIEDVLSRYCHYFDRGDAEAWSRLFSENADVEVPGKRMQGGEQLRRFARRTFEATQGKMRHQITNALASAMDDASLASVVAYGLVTDWREPEKLVMLVTYSGMLSRDGEGWKIESMKAARA